MTTTKAAAKKALKKEIQEGAWTTPGGDPFVDRVVTDEGDCAYCGEPVYGCHGVTESGMKLAIICTVWRWFNNEFEVWHKDCLKRWSFAWTMNANKTVHIVGCRHAEPDGQTYQGTRGEARHILNDRFCNHCAPLAKWLV